MVALKEGTAEVNQSLNQERQIKKDTKRVNAGANAHSDLVIRWAIQGFCSHNPSDIHTATLAAGPHPVRRLPPRPTVNGMDPLEVDETSARAGTVSEAWNDGKRPSMYGPLPRLADTLNCRTLSVDMQSASGFSWGIRLSHRVTFQNAIQRGRW